MNFMADATANHTKPRVLVADDEQVIANTLAIILNQAGFEARAVFSGEKAIEALDTFNPNMLISDVIMSSKSLPSQSTPPTCSLNCERSSYLRPARRWGSTQPLQPERLPSFAESPTGSVPPGDCVP